MNPITQFILATLLGTGTTFIGGKMQNAANKEAAAKSEALTNRQLDEQERSNRFGEKMSKENLALNKEQLSLAKNRFNQDVIAQNYGIGQNELNRVVNMLNTNTGLANNVLSKWGI